MKRINCRWPFLLLILSTQASGPLFAQVYIQNFNGTLASSGWTNTNLTVPWSSGSFFGLTNNWYVDDAESGRPPTTCGAANMGNYSLYMGCVGLGPLGAAYVANARTNRRISSPNISTIGFSNMTLNFDFIGNGAGTTDKAYLQYSTDGGATWISPTGAPTSANPALPLGSSLNNLKSQICGSGQGRWTHITWNLPPACENIPNLRIAFVWQNNASTSGATDPCLAVNDLSITITPLPVGLIEFKAACFNNAYHVEWSTASEVNNNFFTLERSFDMLNWETVEIFQGALNSSVPVHYSFNDSWQIYQNRYYRLHQTDLDGKNEILKIIHAAGCTSKNMSVKFYPNPAADKLTVEFEPSVIGNCVLHLFSEKGIPVYRSQLNASETSHTLSTMFLRPAGYFLRVESRGETIFETEIIISR